MAKLGAQRLQSILQALGRLEHGGARERAAVAIGMDEWVVYEDPLPAPGELSPGRGLALGQHGGAQWWLVPGGRVLNVPDDPTLTPAVTALSDTDIAADVLVPPLRNAALTSYLGGVPLARMTGAAVPVVVADLLGLVWDLTVDGRVLVLKSLAAAMGPDDGWDLAAMRLKAGFERGLSDRAAAVRAVATEALVRMGLGLGPRMSMADPAKTLAVLFAVPYADVQATALRTLDGLDDAVLAPVAPVLAPLLQAAGASADPESRRLASGLQVRLIGRPAVVALAADLGNPDVETRLAALAYLADDPGQALDVLLPRVLDSVADPEPDVRAAAAVVLEPVLGREPAPIRNRVLQTLVAAPDARAARVAIDYLAGHPTVDPEVVRALNAAVAGPEANRPAVVTVLSGIYSLMPAEESAEGCIDLLRNRDPVVRQAVLRDLAAHPPERVVVREEIYQALTEHLRDPEAVLRVETARTLVMLGYPRAPETVAQLALDPDPVARRGVLAVLREAGDDAALRQAAALARQVDALMQLPEAGDGDARVRWSGALDALLQEPSPQVLELLAAVLGDIPPDTTDPFLRQAMADIDAQLLERTGGGLELVNICRHLMAPPRTQAEHATRLAFAAAAESPLAFDFLWTVYVESGGAAAEAARHYLAELVPRRKSESVREELTELLSRTDDPARRDVLRTLLTSAA